MKKILLNLQRFSEGGGDGAGAAAGAGEVSSPAAGDKGRKANPLADVKYGKQPEEQTEENPVEEQQGEADNLQQEPKDKSKLFDEMIKGEYKEEFSKRTSEIVRKRLEKTRQLEEQMNSANSILEMVSQKYGVDAKDMDALTKAIQEDDSYYEEEAMQKGMTVQQLKEVKRLERENQSLRNAREEFERKRQADNIYSGWLQQSEQLKQVYPGFDFATETQNEDFNALLRNGIDVKTAYEVIHKDEIIGGAMQYTAQQVKQKTVENIRARGNRPAENGMSSQASAVVKSDVNKLTKADREEIERRVLRGEKITF